MCTRVAVCHERWQKVVQFFVDQLTGTSCLFTLDSPREEVSTGGSVSLFRVESCSKLSLVDKISISTLMIHVVVLL